MICPFSRGIYLSCSLSLSPPLSLCVALLMSAGLMMMKLTGVLPTYIIPTFTLYPLVLFINTR
ncbi:hypothetical protein F5X96DRAFT_615251 [Biscogniauxia mediterranea]|nr:hypothetical protein F5X96DRAFT_615251 [Biscogniauxia mediterranea]